MQWIPFSSLFDHSNPVFLTAPLPLPLLDRPINIETCHLPSIALNLLFCFLPASVSGKSILPAAQAKKHGHS